MKLHAYETKSHQVPNSYVDRLPLFACPPISKSIKKINGQVYNEILFELEAVTNSLKSENKRQTENLKNDLMKRKNLYLKDISIKIVTLREQAEIARSLNIFENSKNIVNALKSISGDIISLEKFDYLRGRKEIYEKINYYLIFNLFYRDCICRILSDDGKTN